MWSTLLQTSLCTALLCFALLCFLIFCCLELIYLANTWDTDISVFRIEDEMNQ